MPEIKMKHLLSFGLNKMFSLALNNSFSTLQFTKNIERFHFGLMQNKFFKKFFGNASEFFKNPLFS